MLVDLFHANFIHFFFPPLPPHFPPNQKSPTTKKFQKIKENVYQISWKWLSERSERSLHFKTGQNCVCPDVRMYVPSYRSHFSTDFHEIWYTFSLIFWNFLVVGDFWLGGKWGGNGGKKKCMKLAWNKSTNPKKKSERVNFDRSDSLYSVESYSLNSPIVYIV